MPLRGSGFLSCWKSLTLNEAPEAIGVALLRPLGAWGVVPVALRKALGAYGVDAFESKK